jgi:MYXO-CTERM domain-containing protein
MQRMKSTAVAAGVAVLAGAGVAWADIGDPVIVFEATGSMGSGSYQVTLDDGGWVDDQWFWMADGPIEIRSDGGDLIVTLTEGSAFIQEDPVIALGFAVIAGASDTVFTISSSTVSFPTIFGAIGRTSAGVTLTESNGNTATMTGLQPGGTLFSANYNGGTGNFANLLTGPYVESSAFGTESDTDEFPAGGAFALVGDVSDISVNWGFELSAGDQASGTSVFVVVPTPATLALLAIGGIATRRRR